jgi:hypothetical protein
MFYNKTVSKTKKIKGDIGRLLSSILEKASGARGA